MVKLGGKLKVLVRIKVIEGIIINCLIMLIKIDFGCFVILLKLLKVSVIFILNIIKFNR